MFLKKRVKRNNEDNYNIRKKFRVRNKLKNVSEKR